MRSVGISPLPNHIDARVADLICRRAARLFIPSPTMPFQPPDRRALRRVIPTPPPFRLKPRPGPSGTIRFEHSGAHHAYLPIIVAVITGFIAVLVVTSLFRGPGPVRLQGLHIPLAIAAGMAIVSLSSLVIAWIGAGRGMRLTIDPVRHVVTIERIHQFGHAHSREQASLGAAELRLHDLAVTTRDPRPHVQRDLAKFHGQALLLHAGNAAFALAAVRKEVAMNAYIQSLPPPLDALPIDLGDPISGLGGIAVF